MSALYKLPKVCVICFSDKVLMPPRHSFNHGNYYLCKEHENTYVPHHQISKNYARYLKLKKISENFKLIE